MNAIERLNQAVDGLLADLTQHGPLRAGALAVTVFGDIVMPRGGAISTQSLLDMTRVFGLGEGVMRTALSRLSANGVFARTRVGRRSFYGLTERAWDEYEDADRLIYAPTADTTWNGDWLVVLDVAEGGGRIADDTALKKHLRRLGFAKAGPQVFLRPSTADTDLRKRLDLLLDDQPALVIDGHGGPIPTGFKGTVENMWDVDDLARGYNRFVRRFSPLAEAMGGGVALDDRHALILRVLCIHEYRRLILADPRLPLEILPADWAGDLAQAITRELYGRLFEASERWIEAHCTGEDGALPPNSAMMMNRFGGFTPSGPAAGS